MPSYEEEMGTKQNKGTDTEFGFGTSLCLALQVLKLAFSHLQVGRVSSH